jgi:hypothetical protein
MFNIFRTLPGLVNDLDGDDAVRESLVFTAWHQIAGELLSEHTVPLELRNSRLAVAVSSNVWKAHLEDLAPQMLYKLNTALGSSFVKYIDLRIDEQIVHAERLKFQGDGGAAAAEMEKKAKKMVTKDIRNAADAIADEELRNKFLLAAGSCLVRQQRLTEREPDK